MNCYHLKDWIENDDENPTEEPTLRSFINTNPSMKICRDICNSTKHLTFLENRAGQEPEFKGKEVQIEIGKSEEPILSEKYNVNTISGPRDAFTLATECVKAWDAFFAENSL